MDVYKGGGEHTERWLLSGLIDYIEQSEKSSSKASSNETTFFIEWPYLQ